MAALKGGATSAIVCNHWAKGGEGALDLADAVLEAIEKPSKFKFLYDNDLGIVEKINIIAREMYGAGEVILADTVKTYFTFNSIIKGKTTILQASIII